MGDEGDKVNHPADNKRYLHQPEDECIRYMIVPFLIAIRRGKITHISLMNNQRRWLRRWKGFIKGIGRKYRCFIVVYYA